MFETASTSHASKRSSPAASPERSTQDRLADAGLPLSWREKKRSVPFQLVTLSPLYGWWCEIVEQRAQAAEISNLAGRLSRNVLRQVLCRLAEEHIMPADGQPPPDLEDFSARLKELVCCRAADVILPCLDSMSAPKSPRRHQLYSIVLRQFYPALKKESWTDFEPPSQKELRRNSSLKDPYEVLQSAAYKLWLNEIMNVTARVSSTGVSVSHQVAEGYLRCIRDYLNFVIQEYCPGYAQKPLKERDMMLFPALECEPDGKLRRYLAQIGPGRAKTARWLIINKFYPLLIEKGMLRCAPQSSNFLAPRPPRLLSGGPECAFLAKADEWLDQRESTGEIGHGNKVRMRDRIRHFVRWIIRRYAPTDLSAMPAASQERLVQELICLKPGGRVSAYLAEVKANRARNTYHSTRSILNQLYEHLIDAGLTSYSPRIQSPAPAPPVRSHRQAASAGTRPVKRRIEQPQGEGGAKPPKVKEQPRPGPSRHIDLACLQANLPAFLAQRAGALKVSPVEVLRARDSAIDILVNAGVLSFPELYELRLTNLRLQEGRLSIVLPDPIQPLRSLQPEQRDCFLNYLGRTAQSELRSAWDQLGLNARVFVRQGGERLYFDEGPLEVNPNNMQIVFQSKCRAIDALMTFYGVGFAEIRAIRRTDYNSTRCSFDLRRLESGRAFTLAPAHQPIIRAYCNDFMSSGLRVLWQEKHRAPLDFMFPGADGGPFCGWEDLDD